MGKGHLSMRTSHNSWFHLAGTHKKASIAGLLGLCALVFFALYSYTMLASSTPKVSKSSHNPTMTIEAGFQNTYRSGYWTPVRVTINNAGPAFQGRLSIQTFSGAAREQHIDMLSPWNFNQTVTLTEGAQKELTLNVPYYTGNLITRGFIATLSNEQGQVVSAQTSRQGYEVRPGNTFVGVLSDNAGLSAQLEHITLINEADTLSVSPLDAHTMPTMEPVLENFDILVLNNFPTNTLNAQQLSALQIWVNRGGILLEVGGRNWQRTLAPLPASLLPVTLQGLELLPMQTHLLPFNGYQDDDVPPLSPTISTATLHPQTSFSNVQAIARAHNNPLLVQAKQGAGTICYLAFDPAAPPLDKWGQSATIWRVIMQRALGDKLLIASGAQSYDGGPGQILTRGGVINLLTTNVPRGTLGLVVLLVSYLLVLGPARLWFLYRQPQPHLWNWRITISSILIFSLFAYGYAVYAKSRAVTNNSVSILQISQHGTSAHSITYMGLLAPNAGNIQMHVPGANLTEPIDGQYLDHNTALPMSTRQQLPTTVTYSNQGTQLTVNNTDRWTVDPLVSEQDLQLQGRLSGQLTIRNYHVIGDIHNNLQTGLSDTYVLFPHTAIPLGHLGAGQTHHLDYLLKRTGTPSEQSLSEQIARQAGFPGQYFPYQSKQQPQTDLQQHMALLAALSGAGYNYTACEGSCLTHAIASKSNIYVTGGQIPDPNLKNDYDPLLIPGAQATFIGWSDQPLTGLQAPSVNNQIPQGQHISLVQLPLAIQFAGRITIPPDTITGNVIDINSYDVGAILPGAYTLLTGNVRFELPLPTASHLAIDSITITIPDLLVHPSGSNSGSSNQTSKIEAKLYNWSQQKWESIRISDNDTFTSTNPDPYTGPNGRILVQVGSKNAVQIYFGKPTLTIIGNSSS